MLFSKTKVTQLLDKTGQPLLKGTNGLINSLKEHNRLQLCTAWTEDYRYKNSKLDNAWMRLKFWI